jgi:uncharacterized protein (DUF58 family)
VTLPDVDRSHIRALTEKLTLPLRQGLRRTSGNVPGSNAGSSIDFQDHRPYVPGDDPRHIDWQAYARSGSYTMKLYREEVRPCVDIAFDASSSMVCGEAKAIRTSELLIFCIESALRSGAALRVYSLGAQNVQTVDCHVLPEIEPGGGLPALGHVPWRPGSLRVWISDLLFSSEPQALLRALMISGGRPVLFAPCSEEEKSPDWLGNTELLDAETSAKSDHLFREEDLRRYTEAYQAHFALWQENARAHGIPFARVPASASLSDALSSEALKSGAVELV